MTTTRWAYAALLIVCAGAGCGEKKRDSDNAVRTPCTSSADCAATQFCWGEVCSPKLLVGHCADSSEHKANEVCQTGTCVGGSCCRARCAASDSAVPIDPRKSFQFGPPPCP
jgi:hypothetical protein